MKRREFLAAGIVAATLPRKAFAADPMSAAAREAVGDARTTVEKVRAVIAWTHKKLDWTSTDYKQRTALQILERGGGNCYEQAVLVRALLEPAGVKTRIAREVNSQPAKASRQKNAEEQIAKVGPRASVFGERHNDHAWTEYLNEEWNEWTPADPTLNILGYDGWIKARLGFGARPVHEIIPYADMLFPITIGIPHPGGRWESRTERYLVEGFASHINGVWRSPRWPTWVRLIGTADERLARTFAGQHNFHEDRELIDQLIAVYEGLKADTTRSA